MERRSGRSDETLVVRGASPELYTQAPRLMKTDAPATGSSDVFFVSLAVPRSICHGSRVAPSRSRGVWKEEVDQEVYRERGCEHAHLPSRVLSSVHRRSREIAALCQPARSPAGKVESHFGGGRCT